MSLLSHQTRSVLWTASLAALLAACTVGPDYQSPATPVPNKWTTAAPQASNEVPTQTKPVAPVTVGKNVKVDDSVRTNAPSVTQAEAPVGDAPIDQVWWQNFHDPLLDQLVAKALDSNFDLQIAATRILQSRANRVGAAAQLLPEVDAKGSGTRQGNDLALPGSAAAFKKPFNNYQTGFDASWELDLFGGERRGVEAATAQLQSAVAAQDEARVSLLAEVARTYIDIRRYQNQLAVTQETIKSDKGSLAIVQSQYNSGTTAHVDVIREQAQVQAEQAQEPADRANLVNAELSMDLLLGAQPGTVAQIVAATAPIPLSNNKLLLTTPASVIANRPDIRQAERNLAAATAQQGVAAAKFYPDISLNAFIGLLSPDIGTLFTGGAKAWMVSGSVLWPILSFGRLEANQELADAQQQEMFVTYQKTVLSALVDVNRAINAYQEAIARQAALAQNVDSNQHALSVIRERYKAGLTNFLDVLDAERTLYQSQQQLLDARAEISFQLVAVYKSLGGGWQMENVPQTLPPAAPQFVPAPLK